MKILIITRIHTGMVDSIASKKWQPKGMPSYYKLLEALNEHDEAYAVCLGKTVHKEINRADVFRFPGLGKINFYVKPYRRVRMLPLRLNDIVNEMAGFFYCARLVKSGDHDLIYADRENIIFAAIFKMFFRKKVVVRLHGSAFLIKRLSGAKKWIKEPFKYISYKAPFDYVICSKDGSGARYFIEKFMNKNTPYEILLNGVDEFKGSADAPGAGHDFLRAKYKVPADHKIILFVGRITYDKGIRQFIQALAELSKLDKKFLAVIIGEGVLRPELEKLTARSGIKDNVIFEGAVRHETVYNYFRASDIYVSLNLAGNLSNTVLEAINAGKCIVTFKEDSIDHTDEDTVKVLSGNAVLIDKKNISGELPAALADLLDNDEKINSFSVKTGILAGNLLRSWDERIQYESELLRQIAERKKGEPCKTRQL